MAEAVAKPANPAPLGLAGFGLTTVVLSSINAGLLPRDALPAVVPLAFAFGGVAQLLSGMMEYRNRNTFGTVAFTSYGLFWWWWALLQWTVGAHLIAAPSAAGVGVTLLMWGVFTFGLWVSTLHTGRLGGWIGLACGLTAMYVSIAEVTNGTFGRGVLPLGSPFLKS